MGHEMSHVILRHGTNQASKQKPDSNRLRLLGSQVVVGLWGWPVGAAWHRVAQIAFLLEALPQCGIAGGFDGAHT